MKTSFKIKNDKYFFFNDHKQIFVSKNKPLFVYNKLHAKNILKEINYQSKDQYSLKNLTFFSCALNSNDKNKIIKILLEFLNHDLILFRFFEDKNLQKVNF